MDALLIIASIVLLMIGWVWLIVASLHLPTARIVFAALLPLLTLFSRGRGYPRLPRIVLGVGLLSGLLGLATLFHLHPHRFEALVTGAWLTDNARVHAVDGEIMGQRFRPDRVYWRGSDLVLEEGPVERLRRSVTIRFADARQLLDGPTVERLPNDAGEWPEVILQWHQGALTPPGLRQVQADFSLSLDFYPAQNGTVPLGIHLRLPATHQTWVSGEARLDQEPDWLKQVRLRERQLAERSEAKAVTPAQADSATPADSWQPVSMLALLDEPQLYAGSEARITLFSGRVHQGRLKGVTDELRVELAQAHGPNQVDFQFDPVDIRLIETRPASR